MKKYFFTGLVTLLPLTVTIWILYFVVNLLTKPFVGIVTALLLKLPSLKVILSEGTIESVSQILILIFLFILTLFLGFVAQKYFFSKLISLGDRLIHRIPLVNKVYKTSKELVTSLFSNKQNAFKQAVLIPFPYKGSYCIGLITRESPKTTSAAANQEMLSIFIPTTPNPATGFLILCARSDIIFLNMKSEEAIKYIVSCGVIQPEKIRT